MKRPAKPQERDLTFVLMQLNVSHGDPQQNIDRIRQAFASAELFPGCAVILPELWNTGYDLQRMAEIADKDGTQAQRLLCQLALEYQVYIIGGSIARATCGKYYNTTYCFDPKGVKQGEYNKVHLFGPMNEDRYLTAGNRGLIVSWDGIRVAPVICYDIRFPEWLRTLAVEGVDIFVVPAQWPESRIGHWRKLLQARAIENQAFVVAVNRVGSDPDNSFGGHSLVVAPSGEVLLELAETEGTGKVTVNLSRERYRNSSVLSDRRPELYH